MVTMVRMVVYTNVYIHGKRLDCMGYWFVIDYCVSEIDLVLVAKLLNCHRSRSEQGFC